MEEKNNTLLNNTLLNISLKILIIFTSVLIIIKFILYRISDSLAIFSSFADSSLDFINSLISFVAFKYSLKEKNENYQYGYHGIIDITTIIIASSILFTSFTIFYKSFINIINHNLLEYTRISVLAMFFSTLASISLTVFLNYSYKKTNSILIKHEIAHYASDILTNIGILISLIVCKFYNNYLIDPIIAIIMGLISIKPAIEILKNAIDNIMSKEVNQEIRDKIIEIVTRDKNVMGYHKFKTRKSGDKIFIQIDIELSSMLPFKISHDIVDKIEKDIEKKYIIVKF